MRISCLLLLLSGGGYLYTLDPPAMSLQATVDKSLNIQVVVNYTNTDTHSSITGFTISFSTEDGEDWREIELLTSDSEYSYQITGTDYDIRQNTGYRLRACVAQHHVRTFCSPIVRVHTRDAAAQAPILHVPEVLLNGSAVFTFVPGEDADLVANYSLEYREENEPEWRLFSFQSDPSSRFVLPGGLAANGSRYIARLFLTGDAVAGNPSQEVAFDTSSIAELPVITLTPSSLVQYDPDLLSPLLVQCSTVCQPPADLRWEVNGQSIHLDHAFYTVTSSVDGTRSTSSITAKSRTRSDTLTCVAVNGAGEARASVRVKIRGPGSPPSSVKLTAEPKKFIVGWLPPSQPNGIIRKFVVYHSQNREEPLSDWMKINLDGSERAVALFQEAKDSFYVRVQAATDDGPGIISDVVAIERDSVPIAVRLNYSIFPDRILDPGQNITVQCLAEGRPRPQLSYALSDRPKPGAVESDVWRSLSWRLQDGRVVGQLDLSLVSSKYLHCRAKNSVGFNFSSLHFEVQKPGDPPRNVKIASVDARHVTIVWESPNYPNQAIESYEVLLSDSDDSSDPLLYAMTPREGIDVHRLSIKSEDLSPSTEYFCRVRARNAAGLGPLSDPVQFITANGGPEHPPHSLHVEINEANTAVLRWLPPNCTSPVESYVVYLTRDLGISNEEFQSWNSAEIPATLTRYRLDHQLGLKPKSLYRVRMTAKNKEAEGPPSQVVEFESAHSSLPIPTEVHATVTDDNSVVITFPAVRDPDDTTKTVQMYRLEVAEGEVPPSAGWHVVPSAHISVDESSGLAEIHILSKELNTSRSHWLRVSTILSDSSRTLPSSKPIHFKTGRGKLTTRAVIEEGEHKYTGPSLNETLSLTCIGEGSPAPNISWHWNGAAVDLGSWKVTQEILSDTKTRSVLSRVGVQESGNITCQTTNTENSSSATLQLKIVGPGSPPTNIRLIPHKNVMNVTWSEPKVPNGEILRYVVYFSFENSPHLNDWDRIEVEGKAAQIDVIAPSIPHYVKVQAVNDLGYGIISDSVSSLADESYEALELFFEMVGRNSREVEPNEVVRLKCRGKGLPTPRIFRSWQDEQNGVELIPTADDDDFSAAFSVQTRRSRTILCRAENKFDNQTRRIDLVVKKPGDTPQNIEWDFDEVGALLLNWTHIKYPNGESVSYRIYLGHSEVKVPGPPVRWNKDEIPLNVNLDLQISAENEFGEGERSPVAVVRTPNGGPRDPPNVTHVDSIDNHSMVVHWTSPKRPQGTIKKYQLWWQKEPSEEWNLVELEGTATEYNLGAAVDVGYGEKLQLKMAAANERNVGPTSEVATAVSWDPHLPTPTNVSAILKNSTLYIQFDPYSGAQKFVVHLRGEGHTAEIEAPLMGEMLIVPIAEADFFKESEPRLLLRLVAVSPEGQRRSRPSQEIDVTMETSPARRRRPIKEPPL